MSTISSLYPYLCSKHFLLKSPREQRSNIHATLNAYVDELTAKLGSLHDVMHFVSCIQGRVTFIIGSLYPPTLSSPTKNTYVILKNTQQPNTHIREQSRIILFKRIKHGLCNGFCYILGVTKENFSLSQNYYVIYYSKESNMASKRWSGIIYLLPLAVVTEEKLRHIIQKNQTWLPGEILKPWSLCNRCAIPPLRNIFFGVGGMVAS
jgi:hypothetical protein